jgi:thiamine biosynthesis lipoprotein
VLRLERRYSRYLEDSITSTINASAGKNSVAIDDETYRLLSYADTAFKVSGGLFDLTSGVLRRCWDFRSQTLPNQDEVHRALMRVGWADVRFSKNEVFLPNIGMELDFGGVVKEYAVDAALSLLKKSEIEGALVDLAGDMGAFSNDLVTAWDIGIKHPRSPEKALATVQLTNSALASSGDYERCIVIDDRRYSHLLNPKTGWPTNNAPLAVSILAPNCLVAGSSATIAMLMHSSAAKAWLSELGIPWLLVDSDLNVYGTHPLL